MKKFCMALMVLYLITIISVSAQIKPYSVNIAYNKPIYISGNETLLATDGSRDTSCQVKTGENIIIDLGRAYPVDEIILYGKNSGKCRVEILNDPDYSRDYTENDKYTVHELNNCGNEFISNTEEYFRYVRISGQEEFEASEIEVYVRKQHLFFENAVTGDMLSTNDGAVVWNAYPLEQASDNNAHTFCALNYVTPYIDVDLGMEKDISHVEVMCRRDMLTDREGIRITASNDKDFKSFCVIGEQIEEIGINASFVRRYNGNEKFRYIRVEEGNNGFLVLAEIKVFAGETNERLADVAEKIIPNTEQNAEVAYKITDGDVNTVWSGNKFTLDLKHCFPIKGFEICGTGSLNITAYNDKNKNISSSYAVDVNGSAAVEGNGEYYRYIEVEAADEMEIGYFKILAPYGFKYLENIAHNVSVPDGVKYYADSLKEDKLTNGIENDACAFTCVKGYVTIDFGRIRKISHVEAVTSKMAGGNTAHNKNYKVEISDTSDFSKVTAVVKCDETLPVLSVWAADFKKPVYGRYARVYNGSGYFEVGEIYVMAYKDSYLFEDKDGTVNAEIQNSSMLSGGDGNIYTAFFNGNKLSDVIKTNGNVPTERLKTPENFDNIKVFGWNGLTPVSNAENVEFRNQNIETEFYVSADGADTNDGSENAPFRTIEKAMSAVRQKTADMQGDIIVNIGDGRYNINNTLEFTEADGGKNGFRVIYKNSGKSKPVISGGKRISGFERNNGNIWSMELPEFDKIYELYINGNAASMAGGVFKPVSFFSDGIGYEYDGMYFDSLPILSNPSDVFIHTMRSWHDYYMKVENSVVENGRNKVNMVQPAFNIAAFAEKQLPVTPAMSYTVENAYELLDSPGEFYFNRNTKVLYYIPRDGEDLNEAVIEVPMLDTLVKISGDGVNNHIENLSFEGIKFECASNSKRYRFGLMNTQAQQVRTAEYSGRFIDGTIQVDYASGISIEDCEITGVQKPAVSFGEGVTQSKITGNEIHDIGGGAVSIGKTWHDAIEVPLEKDTKFDCFGRKAVYASSGDTADIWDEKELSIFNTDAAGRSWESHESDLVKGIKPWIILDLEKPYSIDSVSLKFANPQNKFRVRASNDENFTSYKTLGAVGTTAQSTYQTSSSAGQKYRYIKIEKTAVEHFEIQSVCVWSSDENVHRIEELCSGNTVSNNNIYNTALQSRGEPAVTVYFAGNTDISHNNIIESGYSGISVGWGWANSLYSTTCRNNAVRENYIKNFNQRCSDGGAVYTLGQQPGTVICGNYIVQNKPVVQGYSEVGIYTDEGSAYMTVKNNVIDMPESQNRYDIMIWTKSIHDIDAFENYAVCGRIRNDGTDCILKNTIKYNAASPEKEVERIINDAGAK